MLERGEGYLLSTASAAGLLSQLGAIGYATTKHAAVAVAEWLDITYRDRGLRVSCLCPQFVNTPMVTEGLDVDKLQKIATIIEPEQVADDVVAAMLQERFLILPTPRSPSTCAIAARTTRAGSAGCGSCRRCSAASSARRSSLRAMDDGTLRERLWQGFARLQTLLGGEAAGGVIVEEHGIVASFVPSAPDSPTLNAAIVVADELDLELLDAMRVRWDQLGVRRCGIWTDGAKYRVTDTLRTARMRGDLLLAGHGRGDRAAPAQRARARARHRPRHGRAHQRPRLRQPGRAAGAHARPAPARAGCAPTSRSSRAAPRRSRSPCTTSRTAGSRSSPPPRTRAVRAWPPT